MTSRPFARFSSGAPRRLLPRPPLPEPVLRLRSSASARVLLTGAVRITDAGTFPSREDDTTCDDSPGADPRFECFGWWTPLPGRRVATSRRRAFRHVAGPDRDADGAAVRHRRFGRGLTTSSANTPMSPSPRDPGSASSASSATVPFPARMASTSVPRSSTAGKEWELRLRPRAQRTAARRCRPVRQDTDSESNPRGGHAVARPSSKDDFVGKCSLEQVAYRCSHFILVSFRDGQRGAPARWRAGRRDGVSSAGSPACAAARSSTMSRRAIVPLELARTARRIDIKIARTIERPGATSRSSTPREHALVS